MAYQYPYSKTTVADDIDFVLADHMNKQEDQLFELTEAIKALDDAYPKGSQLTGHAGEYLKVTGAEDGFEFTSTVVGPHKTEHQNGGADEIAVGGLSGELADPQLPKTHASVHENGGGDEISIAGLSGALADDQTPTSHASVHENGGGDEISLAGLSGETDTPQIPKTHKDTHISGGSDPFGTSDFLEAVVKRIRTTSGPANLVVGAIPDNEILKRFGSSIVGGGFFGQNAQNAEDRTLSTTTATTPQQKLKMTTPSLPVGTYRIGWGWSWYFTSGANDFAARVQVDDDGALILIEQQETPGDTGADQRHIVGGFAYITFGSPGTHDIDIDFYRIGGIGTAGIRDARLEIWRVS